MKKKQTPFLDLLEKFPSKNPPGFCSSISILTGHYSDENYILGIDECGFPRELSDTQTNIILLLAAEAGELDDEIDTPETEQTFRLGDKIEVDVEEGVKHLMIVGVERKTPSSLGRVHLINVMTGQMGPSNFLFDTAHITKDTLLVMGKQFGLTPVNFTKVDCSTPPPFSSEIGKYHTRE